MLQLMIYWAAKFWQWNEEKCIILDLKIQIMHVTATLYRIAALTDKLISLMRTHTFLLCIQSTRAA